MEWFTGAVWLPLLGALLHPILGWCVQSGTKNGVRLTVIVAVANFLTAILFGLYLRPEGAWALSRKDWWAIANGILFFFGQWFSIQSVKSGDIAVHSSALGIKVVVVAVFSLMVGLEESSLNLLLGVGLAVSSVYLVAGGSASGWKEHRETVGLTVLACLFFGMNDFLTGWQSREIGPARWLMLMMSTSGVISLGLIIQRRAQLPILVERKKIGFVVLGAGLCLGTQALLVNLAFSQYGQPTLSNVVYSCRGIFAVLFLWLIGRKMDPRFRKKQIAGAILMVAALLLTLS